MSKGSGTTRKTMVLKDVSLGNTPSVSPHDYLSMSATDKLGTIISDIRNSARITRPAVNVGKVETEVKTFSQTNDIQLGDGNMYFTSKSISHSLRESKVAKGLAVAPQVIKDFPQTKSKMAVYYDGAAFVYTDYASKFIVRPNQSVKTENGKTNGVLHITAGVVRDPNEFNNPRYTKIKDKT